MFVRSTSRLFFQVEDGIRVLTVTGVQTCALPIFVVFVPFWVLITMALIGVLYALIFATILLRTPDIAADTRRASFHSAVSYSLVVLPLMIFLVDRKSVV